MHYAISKADLTTRYEYTFENNTSCVFLVDESGVIYIKIRESIPFKFLIAALNEVTDIIIQNGLIPKINIKNSNNFLKFLAKRCKYRKIPSKGISFSIWTRPNT